MPALKMTLQNRITTLMILSSFLFIATFTFIQINNQVANINRYNSYQANLSANLVKNTLEASIIQLDQEEISKSIQSNLSTLKDGGIIKEAIVFDKAGKIVAATKEELVGNEASYKDTGRWLDFEKIIKNGRPFTTQIDKLQRKINIYVGLKSNLQAPIAYVAKLSLDFARIQEAFQEVYQPVFLAIIIVLLANIIFGYALSKTVLGPIKVLNKVTKIIAEGDLSVKTHIKTDDELEELGSTFNYMTEQLIRMKERAENANPLTKLPGNIVIHEEVEKNIDNNKKFSVLYCDLDNFKAFNDKYGIAKGDEAIKITAELFKEAVKSKGNPDDFVGHEGGDDFILLSTPEKAKGIADYIIQEFDRRVRSLYNQEDLNQGFIIAHARDGSIKKFPIMSISLAEVNNEAREITSYGQVTNIAAEVKKKAKATEGSVFVMDKRLG